MKPRSPAPKPTAGEETPAVGSAPTVPAVERYNATTVLMVSVRVISPSHGHQVDAVVSIPASEVAEAERLGWADSRPEAVAEAERLGKLHKDNQGFDWRTQD